MKKLIHPLYNFLQLFYGKLNSWLAPWFLPLSPMVLRLRLTSNCNLSCDFCFLKEGLNVPESDHLGVNEWKRIIEHLPRRTIIDIAGNEPFLARDFAEIISLFLDRGFRVSLITNGMSVNKELIELLVKKKLTYLMVSIDGMSETHNRLRGHPESFERARLFIQAVQDAKKKLGATRPVVCVKTALTEEGIGEMEELQRYVFDDLKVDQQTINLLFQNQGRGGNRLLKNVKDLMSIPGNTHSYSEENQARLKSILRILTKRDEVNVKPPMNPSFWSQYIEKPNEFGVRNCSKPYSVLTLYYNGRVTPCDLALDLGNIREIGYDLRKIWKRPEFANFWRSYNDAGRQLKACEGCNLSVQTSSLL